MRSKRFGPSPVADATTNSPRAWRQAMPPTIIAAAIAAMMAPAAHAASGISPVTTCDAAGIGRAAAGRRARSAGTARRWR